MASATPFAPKVGLLFASLDLNVSPVWPGAGVALAALFLGGKKLWPGIVLGSLVADLTAGVSMLPAIGNATANTLEALVGVLLLTRLLQFSPTLRTMRDTFSLAAASALAPLLGAMIGVGVLVATRTIPVSEAWYNYRLFWFGDALGCLLFAPLIFALSKSFEWTWRNLLQVATATMLMAAVSFIALVNLHNYFPFTFISAGWDRGYLETSSSRSGHRFRHRLCNIDLGGSAWCRQSGRTVSGKRRDLIADGDGRGRCGAYALGDAPL